MKAVPPPPALFQADDQFRLLFESASDGYLLFDDAGVVDCNGSALRMLGLADKEALRALHPWRLSPEFQPDGRRSGEKSAEMDAVALRHGSHRFEWVHRRADGSDFPVEVTLTPIQLYRGPGLLAVWHDLSDVERAQRGLRENRELLDTVLRLSLDGVVVYTAIRDGEGTLCDFRCALLNPAAEKMMSRPRELLAGTLLGAYPSLADDGLFRKFVEVVESGASADFEYCFRDDRQNQRATPRWFRVAAAQLGDGLSVSFSDITARKETERELREAKERAEAAERAKGDFLAMISHELRTPMNGVLGFADLLLDTPLDASQRDYLETIEQSGRTLLSLIDDLLDFSKIGAEKLELEDHPFDLRACLHEAWVLIGPLARKKELLLREEIARDVPEYIFGDSARLRQVVLNLLANAVKFTERGRVELRARLGAVDDRGLRALEVEVRDTGIGIDPKVIDRLFHPFAQADASTTRRFGGTGLGLAICKSLVELMEGRLEVRSTPDEGSVFRFEIPCRPFFATPDETIADSPRPGERRTPRRDDLRVLVCAADPVGGKLLERLLREAGCACRTVAPEAGPDANADSDLNPDLLAALREGSYDAAFVDFQGMEGDGDALACAREMRRADGALPIVAVGAGEAPGARERCLRAGIAHHLPGPATPAGVAGMLGELRGHAAAVPA